MKFDIAINEFGHGATTIFSDGEVTTIQHDHPNFTRINDALVRGENPAKFLNLTGGIENMDERVTILGSTVYFEDQPVHNTLSRTIVRYAMEGRDTAGLIRFMERLNDNPSLRSREALFEWVQNRDLTITEDGCFVGWKGVSHDLHSLTAGKADVDDVTITGYIPNRVGAVISMPRAQVMDDPNIGCSYGLHVGTYDYANGFGSVLLEVKVGPEDVVSVPSDAGFAKLRCCRYEVVRIHENEDDTWDEEYESEVTDDYGEDPGLASLENIVPDTFLRRLGRVLGVNT